MKIGFLEININPEFPVKRLFGNGKHQAVSDDLHCRILVLQKEGKPWYHFSIDTAEVMKEYRDRIKQLLEEHNGEEIDLVVSATHSHYCPGLTWDSSYQEFLLQKIEEHLDELTLQEYGEVSWRFQSRFFDQTGRSRIGAHPSDNVFAQTLSFYGDGKRIGTVLIYNSHPTTLRMGQGDFTSEYPGHVIRRLRGEYPGEFFTFMLGPAGDISSRFTRQCQNYEEIGRLAEFLVQEYQEQLDSDAPAFPVEKLFYREKTLAIRRETPDLSEDLMPEHVSEREAETMQEALDRIPQMDVDRMAKEQMFCQLILSDRFSLLFEPFEMYSSYYDFVDKERCSLITVSNGFDHYITEIGPQWLSMEVYGDTVTDDMKREIGALFEQWSRQEA